jgi:hypothetical protein
MSLTQVKWIGPNDPIIKIARNDARLYITKAELKDLHKQIGEFLEYYSYSFSEERINQVSEFNNSDNWNIA